jgi:hypothetical protein
MRGRNNNELADALAHDHVIGETSEDEPLRALLSSRTAYEARADLFDVVA